ncbi:AMP-binding protein [Streptomyces malaysiensis]
MTTRTLYDWFRASAEASPEDPALEVLDVTLTYAELRAAAEWMSARMVEAMGGRPDRVGLLTSRTAVSYVAYLAVQRLGATAVPLNPAAPASRNVDITKEGGLDLTVFDDTAGDGAAEYRRDAGVRLLDMTGEKWRPCSHRTPRTTSRTRSTSPSPARRTSSSPAEPPAGPRACPPRTPA